MGPQSTCRLAVSLVALSALAAYPQLNAKRDPNLSQEKIASSTASKLQQDLKNLEQYNLSFKIKVSQKIYENTPNSRTKKQLDRLLDQRADVESAIAAASSSSAPIEARLHSLASFANYFLADESLAQSLASSEFQQELDITLSELGAQGSLQELAGLAKAIDAAGLTEIFDSRLESELDRAIQRKVRESMADKTDSEPAEVLTARLLGNPTKGFDIRIKQQGNSDQLWPQFKNSLRRAWGASFQLSFDEESPEEPGSLEIFSTVELSALEEIVAEKEKTVDSKIPGLATVTENPKFAKLVELYKNADRDYRDAVEQFYDTEHRYYLEEIDEIRENTERMVVEKAREDQPDLTEQQILNTNEAVAEVESELKKEVTMRNLNQPQPPERPHERILAELKKTPPTLHSMTEETPYEYTQRSIEVNFKTAAKLSVSSAELPVPSVSRSPKTEHSNNWFETIDAHPRDLTAAKGNYSVENRESARKLFMLDFGADCSRQLRSALSELAQTTYSTGKKNGQDQLIVKALAIQLSQQPSQTGRLDTAKKVNLAAALAEANPDQIAQLLISFAEPLANWPTSSPSVASN